MSLLVQCTKREAFHTLRTVEQLGYMVRPPHLLTSHAARREFPARPMVRPTAEDALLCRFGCLLGMC